MSLLYAQKDRRLSSMQCNPGIDEKVSALRDAEIYGRSGAPVEVVETHMSWVFLVEDQVFKLKKPVRFPFLDFTKLKNREHYVHEEVRLNRRLAPSVYLGVSALRKGLDGRLSLNGQGETVDWLVNMRRLPVERMLDQLIKSKSDFRADMGPVFDLLATFYKSAKAATVTPDERVDRFANQYLDDAAVLLDPCFKLDLSRVESLLDRCDQVLADVTPLLRRQAENNSLVDGHGDLRPEHICLTKPPNIFDCIEFDPRLRVVDPFEEIAFLGLECDRLGAGWITKAAIDALTPVLPVHPSARLFAFYWRSKALLRARLCLAHMLDACPRTPEKWRPLALEYIALAERADDIASDLITSRTLFEV